MPNFNTFKLSGTKLVPINRFNLEPAKPSTTFSAAAMADPVPFTVIAHPVLQSINVAPVILANINPKILFTPKEYFPIINNGQDISENASFIDFNDKDMNLVFPKVEITPNNDNLFYYEDVLDSKGNKSNSLIGRITLKYTIKETPLNANQKYIPLNLKEAVLNLKTKDIPIKINGVVDTAKKEIVFKIMDEAVKIAFLNLITNIEELKCNLDLFFDFKAYTKYRRNIYFAQQIHSLDHFPILHGGLCRVGEEFVVSKEKSAKINNDLVDRSLIQKPLMVRANSAESLVSKDTILGIQKDNNIETNVQAEYVKTTFLLKINKIINYPLLADKSTSLYKTVDGGFITNPFNLNEEFSQFKQIFVPGVNFDKLSIYKSAVQPNTFLLVSKTYCLTRDLDTTKPCMTSSFYASVEGNGLTDISKIEFCFVLGPNLSEFDLAKLKIDLLNNNFLNGDTTNYMDNIQFLYPNDIDANYEVSGNYFLQKSNISLDGKYFIFSLATDKLNEASLLINSLNNSISEYANINFRHKEIKDTSIIDLNMEKSIGKTLNTSFDNITKKIKIENLSLSKCKINAVLTVDEQNANLFNSSFFLNYPLMNSNEIKEMQHASLNPNLTTKNLKKVFFNFESIEDITKEFNQIVSTTQDYNKYIQIQIQPQKANVSKIQIELNVDATQNKFCIEKLKEDFKTPFLFNMITPNSVSSIKTISYKVNCFDKDYNILTTNSYLFDYTNTTTIVIPKI